MSEVYVRRSDIGGVVAGVGAMGVLGAEISVWLGGVDGASVWRVEMGGVVVEVGVGGVRDR